MVIIKIKILASAVVVVVVIVMVWNGWHANQTHGMIAAGHHLLDHLSPNLKVTANAHKYVSKFIFINHILYIYMCECISLYIRSHVFFYEIWYRYNIHSYVLNVLQILAGPINNKNISFIHGSMLFLTLINHLFSLT